MVLKSLLSIVLVAACLNLNAAGATAARSPSSPGAAIAFANLADGDVVPPGFVVRFDIRGMGIAPAGVPIENTGHFHLLVDLDELPDFDQPLPSNEHILHYGKGQNEVALELPEGPHRLQLLLADHAHVPHDPPVMSEVITVVVSASAPAQAGS